MTEKKLTEKQELFCICYAHTTNQTKAARMAGFQSSGTGWKLMRKQEIRQRILQIKGELMHSSTLSHWDLLRTYMQIAFADISDFVEFGQDENGENYLRLKPEKDINGQLVDEVSVTKSGTRFRLADRFKALERLEKFLENVEKLEPLVIVTGVPREGEEQ